MGERARQRAEQALAEAGRLIEAGDVRAALVPLERARRDFLKERDLAGLRSLRAAIEEGYHHSAVEDEPAYERLLYASGQNIRFLSRRRAAEAGLPWEDPHPELEQPGRPEIRAERGLTRRDKIGVVTVVTVAVPLALAAIAAYIGFVVYISRAQHAILLNDGNETVVVGACGVSCTVTDAVRLLEPGSSVRVTHQFGRDWLVVTRPTGELVGCLRADHDGATLRVSNADGCPDGLVPATPVA